MDAILLAGGAANPEDPLYSLSRGLPKALLPIAGKPMAQWVIDAFAASESIDRLVIVGSGPDCGLHFPDSVIFVPDSGSLLGNARAGLMASASGGASSELAIIVAADIPAVRSPMVDWLSKKSSEIEADLYYCAVERATMEARYPGSGRSYVRFKDKTICGGDALVVRAKAFAKNEEMWRRLTEGRKNAFSMAATIGLDVLILLALRRLTIADAARRASARLGIRGTVIDCPYAELGMDVDKPFQFEIVEQDLAHRGGA